MQPVPQDLLKEYVQSQHFTSTTEIMEAMKEMYGRYMDDFFLIHPDKEYLQFCLREIRAYMDRRCTQPRSSETP